MGCQVPSCGLATRYQVAGNRLARGDTYYSSAKAACKYGQTSGHVQRAPPGLLDDPGVVTVVSNAREHRIPGCTAGHRGPRRPIASGYWNAFPRFSSCMRPSHSCAPHSVCRTGQYGTRTRQLDRVCEVSRRSHDVVDGRRAIVRMRDVRNWTLQGVRNAGMR